MSVPKDKKNTAKHYRRRKMNLKKKESLWDNKQKNSVSKRLGKMVSHTARRRGLNTSYFSAHYTLFFFKKSFLLTTNQAVKYTNLILATLTTLIVSKFLTMKRQFICDLTVKLHFCWQQSIINKHANWCRDEAYNRLKDAAGSKLPVKEWLIVAR